MIVAVKSKKGSKSGQREWKLVDDVSTTESKKQRKQRLHREEMVQFRLRKKRQESQLRAQHEQLERQMEQCLSELKQKNGCHGNTSANASENQVGKLQELILQGEKLRGENATLREVVTNHTKLQQMIYSEGDRIAKSDGSGNVEGQSWRVHFPHGEPSFHFHPFSKDESVAIVQHYDKVMKTDVGFTHVGTLLGWQVERSPLVRHAKGKWMVTRVRFSKQIHCATGESNATMDMLEQQSWPVLTNPELSPLVHRANCTTLKLQEIDQDTVVTVSNTLQSSREMHLRHLTMIHRKHTTDREGRRTITYAMVIPDSKANKQSREVEHSRDPVFWVNEGAGYLILTQLDDSTLVVTYDNCTGCKNELHAQHLLMEWGHEAIRWEQLVTPSRLLAM